MIKRLIYTWRQHRRCLQGDHDWRRIYSGYGMASDVYECKACPELGMGLKERA